MVCEPYWDGLTCWPETPVNTTVFRPCPINASVGAVPMAHRICRANGTWSNGNWTNYTLCLLDMVKKNPMENDVGQSARDIYFFGSIISAVLLTITLFIFSYFRTLQCNRISIHKNLVLSFIVRCTILVIYLEPLVTNRKSSYRDKPWLCKLLTCLHQYSLIANIFWMFVEGLFLHNRVAVSVFNSEAPFRVFYAVGWGLPALIVLAWAVCLHLYHDDPCWNNSFNLPYTWIIIVPIMIALMVNLIFLCNIIRILITKLRANNTVEICLNRKAVKALAVLFPLLGTSNLLFFLKPQGETSVIVYRITNAILQSSQGIFVSVIYCFMNGEVSNLLVPMATVSSILSPGFPGSHSYPPEVGAVQIHPDAYERIQETELLRADIFRLPLRG
uniref:G-protein coupled receptors family 2 profile 2 domain-containing protein n=1 Tax=Capitella teleta TaxID=283909 RepID=X1YVY2_CAPTE